MAPSSLYSRAGLSGRAALRSFASAMRAIVRGLELGRSDDFEFCFRVIRLFLRFNVGETRHSKRQIVSRGLFRAHCDLLMSGYPSKKRGDGLGLSGGIP